MITPVKIMGTPEASFGRSFAGGKYGKTGVVKVYCYDTPVSCNRP